MKQYIPFMKKKTKSEQIVDQVSDAASKLSEQAVSTAAAIKSQAVDVASTLKHQASGAASTAKSQAADSASVVATQTAGKVRETSETSDQLSKEVKALAMQAATAAVELLENARERSHAAIDKAPTREQLGLTSTAVSDRAKSAEIAVMDQAQRFLDLAKQAELPIGASVAVAKQKSAVAASSAAKAGKNGFALALWSTALVAIVLYVVMGKERRDKTIKRAKAAAAEVQDLVRDYRGYDGDMETV